MQSTRPCSTRFLRISPSPDWLEDIEPLASTKPATPVGDSLLAMCCTHAKFALPAGGTPYCQRLSSRRRSPPQSNLVEGLASVVLREHVLERGVAALDVFHRAGDRLANGWLTGPLLEVHPASAPRDPEDVGGAVFVDVFGVGAVSLLGDQARVVLLERVRDVLEEDQAEDHMLVLAGVHVAAERVCRLPELGLEGEVRALAGLPCRRRCLASHGNIMADARRGGAAAGGAQAGG